MNNFDKKILVAAPIFDGMEYCINNFIESIKSLDYDKFDILLVDNSKTNLFSKKLKKEHGINVIYLPLGNAPNIKRLIRSRNKILNYAIDNFYDYILMMDCDVIPPTDIIKKLLSHEKDIVSGIYYAALNTGEGQKIESVVWKEITAEEFELVKGKLSPEFVHSRENVRRHLTKEEIESGELQEVMIPSCGCMLICRDVFKKIRYGVLNVPFETTDDIFFCKKAREAGFKLYCDPTIKCDHLFDKKFKKINGKWVHPVNL